MYKLTIVVGLGLFLLTCCNETSNYTTNTKTKGNNNSILSGSIDSTYSSIQNVNNPYNYLGVLHNQAMWYVDSLGGNLLQNDTAGRNGLLADFLIAEFPDSLSVNNKPDLIQLFSDAKQCNSNMTIAQAITQANFSEPTKEFIRNIFSVSEQQQISLDSMLLDFSAIEEEILSSSLSNEQKQPALLMVAYAKHSMCYWHWVYTRENPTVIAKKNGNTIMGGLKKKIPCCCEVDNCKCKNDDPPSSGGGGGGWSAVGTADLKGAFTGFIGGAITGGMIGFVGGTVTVPGLGTIAGTASMGAAGAIVGSFYGAVQGSVTAGFEKLFTTYPK